MPQTQSGPAPAATEKAEPSSRRQLIGGLVVIGLYFAVQLIPRPIAIKPEGWRLLGIFVATIGGLILQPIAGGALVLIAVTLAAVFGGLTIQQALEGYADQTVWLVMSAFFISIAMIKTGFARRMALIFVRTFGKTALGVSYALSLTDSHVEELFVGREGDRGNLSCVALEDYDPETGRYLSADPMGLSAGENHFVYCSADPIDYVDTLFNQPRVYWGPITVVPHWNWRGRAEYGTMADGGGAVCQSGGTRCTSPAWRIQPFAFAQQPADTASAWYGTLLRDKEDGTGTLYRRNRYLDPGTGRFTQEDPIGLAGGTNLYGFANGDLINFGDAFGLCPDSLKSDEKACKEADDQAREDARHRRRKHLAEYGAANDAEANEVPYARCVERGRLNLTEMVGVGATTALASKTLSTASGVAAELADARAAVGTAADVRAAQAYLKLGEALNRGSNFGAANGGAVTRLARGFLVTLSAVGGYSWGVLITCASNTDWQ